MGDVVRLEACGRGPGQGVGVRYHLVREARRLGLAGWVANEPDGSVRTVVEGPSSALDAIEKALRTGPPGALVEAVSTVRMPATGRLEGFAVRSGSHSGD